MAGRILRLAGGLLTVAASSEDPADSNTFLLQFGKSIVAGKRDLAMAYLPYNFGHTVSAKALEVGIKWGDCGSREATAENCVGQRMSKIGCSLMYTPAKYWPEDLAKQEFGNKTVFGILRDPYERMIAQFRGDGAYKMPDLYATCNVNEGVKRRMREYLANIAEGKPFVENCELLPQAEFFDQPYGATVAVDNRLFPLSSNELMHNHGYGDLIIQAEEVVHVSGCDDKWAADLDEEAKSLVRQVYHRDFELLCKEFGYCTEGENTCLTHVPGMCPPQLFTWDESQKVFLRRS